MAAVQGSVRGRDKRNLRFAVLTAGAPRGHAEPGLRDEVIWWQTGDFGQYARFAAAAASRPPLGGAGVRAVIWLIAGQPAQYEQRSLVMCAQTTGQRELLNATTDRGPASIRLVISDLSGLVTIFLVWTNSGPAG